ncbi:LANO_0H21132g1_1 [Lachancea nothofagi CBS 11611]|uniref:LANO_0H21132g1_1 n=1 Tax=Lachancea nothofagi CBS 11611 TaxID=1266666 RepID=A0A1G4KNG2_9SACH|nr:LANO_0H21132g1_1 [Lachancea nothofagi CBS 11611]
MVVEKSTLGGFPSTIYHLDSTLISSDKDNVHLFVFIPGNPGLIEYYEPFLNQIHEKNPEWEMLGISHAGMNSCDTIECPVYSLQEQITHKIKVINNYTWQSRPLIIMGHSVGAFMVQKIAMAAKLMGKVTRLGLLTPTVIDIHKSEKGLKLVRANLLIPRFHEVVSTISWILFEKLFPTFLTLRIISVMVGDVNSCIGAATKLLITNSRFVKQALGLAAEEMQVIRSDWSFQDEFLRHCKHLNIKIWWLFSANDHWVSADARQDLIQFYESRSTPDLVEIDVSPTLEHAFVRKDAEVVIREYFGKSKKANPMSA